MTVHQDSRLQVTNIDSVSTEDDQKVVRNIETDLDEKNTEPSIAIDYIFGLPTSNGKHGIANESDLLLLDMQNPDTIKKLPTVVSESEDFGPESDVDAVDESSQRNLLQEEHEQFFSEFKSPIEQSLIIAKDNLPDDTTSTTIDNNSVNTTEHYQNLERTCSQHSVENDSDKAEKVIASVREYNQDDHELIENCSEVGMYMVTNNITLNSDYICFSLLKPALHKNIARVLVLKAQMNQKTNGITFKPRKMKSALQ